MIEPHRTITKTRQALQLQAAVIVSSLLCFLLRTQNENKTAQVKIDIVGTGYKRDW